MGSNRVKDEYFATLQGQDYLDALSDKVNVYRDFCATSGVSRVWETSIGAYFGISNDGKSSWQVTPQGEMGELVGFKVNDYAGLLRTELQLAIQNRPAGIAKAINTDIKTLRNARIGTQLVEYYLSDPAHNFEADFVETMRYVLAAAEGFTVQDWDTDAGEEVRPEADARGNIDPNAKPIKQGDLAQAVYPAWNAARDIGAPSPNQDWYIFSERENKFDLAAEYPVNRDEILRLGSGSTNTGGIRAPILFRVGTDNTDFIERHKFIHFPTRACPQGRYTIFVEGAVLLDVPYPYPSKNVHRASEQDMLGTCFAHTSNYDLLALEQVTDTLHSIILNNQSTFGVATIVGPKGGGVSHTELAKGLRYMEVDADHVDKIKPLQLTATPKEVFEYVNMLGTKKGEMSGINSILRGDPSGALKGSSGAAMALLQSNAIMSNGGVQRAFYKLLNSAGTGIIEMTRKFADEERVVKISGKTNSEAIKEFKYTGETLKSVSTVVFEPVNALLQTASGKLTVAQDLLKEGMIKSPRRYIEVLTTGNLNVLLEDEVAMEEAIIEENEMLGEGKPVRAVIVENHEAHINGHQAVIAMPNAKMDLNPGGVVDTVLKHIQEHLDLWRQASDTNPALLLATGQKVLPPIPPPGGMQPAPGVPGGAPNNPNGHPSAPPPAPGAPKPNMPNLPNLPKPPVNPATHEPAPMAPGTPVQQP